MSDNYHIKSTSVQSYEVWDNEEEKNIELSSTSTTRKVLNALIVNNASRPEDKLKIKLLHQRKAPSGEWEDIESINLNTLKSGEGVKLDLDSDTTSNLFKELSSLYQVANSSQVTSGKYNLVVGRAEEIIKTDSGRAAIIKKLLENDKEEEIWQAISDTNPDLLTRLSYSRIQEERAIALREFKSNIDDGSKDESYWQNFFSDNQWIFGYGLKYQFLNLVTEQPHFGGQDITGTGDQRGDYLMNTEAETKYTVLVEIKKPSTNLVTNSNRSGSYQISRDLINGISQLQVNRYTWETEGSMARQNQEITRDILTCHPKGILVIGNLAQLDNLDKKTSFELFRRELNNPEIITFDELLRRARFICGTEVVVDQDGETAIPDQVQDPIDEIPF